MYRDLFDEIERMHEEMDRLFSRAYVGSERPLIGHSGKNEVGKYRNPVCHLQETEKHMIATFELPGVDKGDIELNVEKDHIEVKVEQKKEEKKDEKGVKSYYSSSMSFHKFMALPKEIDANSAKAKYENGILRVEMPKVKEIKTGKRLQIE